VMPIEKGNRRVSKLKLFHFKTLEDKIVGSGYAFSPKRIKGQLHLSVASYILYHA
jgi:hypothetical protein